jgi:hypothetical protein
MEEQINCIYVGGYASFTEDGVTYGQGDPIVLTRRRLAELREQNFVFYVAEEEPADEITPEPTQA